MKILKALLIIPVSLAFFGCSNNNPEPTPNPDPPTPTPTSKYTIVWKNEDGAVLDVSVDVEEGTLPVYAGPTPTKPSTQQYSYAFKDWSPKVIPAVESTTYFATYTPILNKYTASFENYNGDKLCSDILVDYGVTPKYKGSTPTKVIEPDDGYTYKFNNTWLPTLSEIEGDTTYVAQYNRTAKEYDIDYELDGGTEPEPGNPTKYKVTDETIVLKEPTKPEHSFTGWQDENQNIVTTIPKGSIGNKSFTATWTNSIYKVTLMDVFNDEYKVKFDLNYDGCPTPTEVTVDSDNPLSYPATIPTREGYAFAGWYTENSCENIYDFSSKVTEDFTLYADWEEMKKPRSQDSTNYYYDSFYVDFSDASEYTKDNPYIFKLTYHKACGVQKYAGDSIYFTSLKGGDITFKMQSNAYLGTSIRSLYCYIYNVSQDNQKIYDKLFINAEDVYYSDEIDMTIPNTNPGDVIQFFLSMKYDGATVYPHALNIYSINNTEPPSETGEAEKIYATQNVNYNQSYTLPIPTKAGKTFAGWYDGVGGTGTQYTDANGASLTAWTIKEDKTLYAKWNG